MSVYTFIVEVEVSDHLGEKQVPYIRELLSNRIHHVGYPKVTYQEWLTDKENVRAETIEKEEYYAGRIDL